MHSIRHSRDVRVACILLMLLLTGQSVRRIVIDRASGLSNLTSVNTSQATDFSLAAQSLTATKATEWDLSNQIVDKPEEHVFADRSKSDKQLSQRGSLLQVQATSSLQLRGPGANAKPDFTGEWKLTKLENPDDAEKLLAALMGGGWVARKGAQLFRSMYELGLNVNVCKIEQTSDGIRFWTFNEPDKYQPKVSPPPLTIADDFKDANFQTSYDQRGNAQQVKPYWEGELLKQDGQIKSDTLQTTRQLSPDGQTMLVTNEFKGIVSNAEWTKIPDCYRTAEADLKALRSKK